MIRSFLEDFNIAWEDISDMSDALSEKRCVTVATARAAYPFIKKSCDMLSGFIKNLEINVCEIINEFYGESITVTGLLTGCDIYKQLSGKELGEELFIPENALKADEDIFLCGMTLEELSNKLGVKVTPLDSDGYEFVRAVIGTD